MQIKILSKNDKWNKLILIHSEQFCELNWLLNGIKAWGWVNDDGIKILDKLCWVSFNVSDN